jgi:predicted nuclease of predicted toxin-antitoxin system
MIVADECLNGKLIAALEQAGYELTAISRTASGIDDLRVLQTAEKLNAVLITEDSDFGEWVFSHHLTNVTIVFLRYDKVDYPVILNFLLGSLKEIEESEERQFITINKNKIRFRKI